MCRSQDGIDVVVAGKLYRLDHEPGEVVNISGIRAAYQELFSKNPIPASWRSRVFTSAPNEHNRAAILHREESSIGRVSNNSNVILTVKGISITVTDAYILGEHDILVIFENPQKAR